MRRRHIAGFKMDFRHPPVVAANEAIQDLGEKPPFLAAEPPMMPKSIATMRPSASTMKLP